MDRIVPGLTARVVHDERSSLLKITWATNTTIRTGCEDFGGQVLSRDI